MARHDPYDLRRFVDAQGGGSYQQALSELRSGHKSSHWMWFVFPQVAGLGRSAMAQRYALSGLGEAEAYANHPVLGPRLIECCQALTGLATTDPVAVLGSIDAQKLRSSMTLFHTAVPDEDTFRRVLEQYFDGQLDEETTSRV